MNESSTSRRQILKYVGVAGAALPAALPSLVRGESAASRLNVAFIGTNGIGAHHIQEFGKLGVHCPCFTDVDRANYKHANAAWPDATGFQDYRLMFDKMEKQFDAVVVGTPDHSHYPATTLALKAGKHVYTQKPLTHTVWEARELTKLAREKGLVTQMGNQGHGREGWRLVYEWVNSGAIGQVLEVHSWTNRPVWPQGQGRPTGSDPVPSTLNWDAWIGPAPMRPFKADTYAPFKWRGFWDFGAGILGDMACHTMDGVFWAMHASYPTAVEPLYISDPVDDTFPRGSSLRWDFPASGTQAAFSAYWHDGNRVMNGVETLNKPARPTELEDGRKVPNTGNLFIGSKATIMVSGDYGDSPRIIPESKMREIGRPPKFLDRSPGNYAEWVQASRGEKPAEYCGSKFSYAGPISEAILLGNVALKVGKKLEWDAARLKVVNAPEANQYINKEYRKGWVF